MARTSKSGGAANAVASRIEAKDLRARILRASVALIDEQGLALLSMREVARRAGVSHQAPYHHFEDRAAVLAAVCEEGFDELRRRTKAALVGAPEHATEMLERCGKAYVSFALAYPAHFRVMFRPELVDVAKFPEAYARAEAAFAELVVVVGRYVACGRGWKGKEHALVSMCWSVAHGLASLLLDGPLRGKSRDAVQLEHHVKDVMQAFGVMIEAARLRGAHAGPLRKAAGGRRAQPSLSRLRDTREASQGAPPPTAGRLPREG